MRNTQCCSIGSHTSELQWVLLCPVFPSQLLIFIVLSFATSANPNTMKCLFSWTVFEIQWTNEQRGEQSKSNLATHLFVTIFTVVFHSQVRHVQPYDLPLIMSQPLTWACTSSRYGTRTRSQFLLAVVFTSAVITFKDMQYDGNFRFFRQAFNYFGHTIFLLFSCIFVIDSSFKKTVSSYRPLDTFCVL